MSMVFLIGNIIHHSCAPLVAGRADRTQDEYENEKNEGA